MNQYDIKRILGKLLINRIFCQKWVLKMFRLKLLRNQSMYKYLKQNSRVIIYEDKLFSMPCRVPAIDSQEYENWNEPKYQEKMISPRYIASIKDACVISELEGIVKDGLFLNDRIMWDNSGMPLYPGNTIIAMSEKYSLQKEKNINKVVDKGIFLLKNFSDNIFHFTIEVLSKLVEIDKYEEFRELPILLDQRIKEDYRNIQLLEALNIYKHEVIWINYNDTVIVKELIVPPINAWVAMDLKVRQKEMLGWMIYDRPLHDIKKLVLEKSIIKKKYNKVYIARGNNERLINESEIIEHLRSIGYEIFYPEQGDFWDEVSCFSTANTIISCAGAALTNLVYSNEKVKVFIICPYKLQSVSYTSITDAMGIKNVHMINADFYKEGESINKSKIKVDIVKLDKIINES